MLPGHIGQRRTDNAKMLMIHPLQDDAVLGDLSIPSLVESYHMMHIYIFEWPSRHLLAV